MSTTLGGIRELPAYSEYTRFGPSFRQSPGSLSGSRASTSSTSRSKGCWCSYLWMILMLILIIISLIASNLSIYFLMKDSCDANLAKFERDMTEEKKFDDMANPFNGRKGFDLGSYFTTPLLSPSSSSTRKQEQTGGKVVTKDFSTSLTTTRLIQSQITSTVATITTTSTTQTRVTQTKPYTQHAGDTGAAVAGILQLEATIRIPQEQEVAFPSSLNPLIEDYFDLSKYFSFRPQFQNDTRNRRTTGSNESKEIKSSATNSALISGQSGTYNDDHDYLSDMIVDDDELPPLTNFPGSSQSVFVAESVDVNPKMAQWFLPFRPLSESSRISEKSVISLEKTSPSTLSTLSKSVKSQTFPNLSFPSTLETKLADSTVDEETETDNSLRNTDVILPSKDYEKSDLFNQFENAVINEEGEKNPALFVSSFNQSVAYTEELTKLPDNIIPTSYIVEWRPHLEPGPSQFSFDGFVLVDFYCQNDTDEILLNAKDLLIDKRSMAVIEKNNFTNTFPIDTVRINDYKSLISFTLIKPLRAGYNYSFGSRFSGNMTYNSAGLSYLYYIDKDGNKKYDVVQQNFIK